MRMYRNDGSHDRDASDRTHESDLHSAVPGAETQLERDLRLQRKPLVVGSVGDSYEREADQVADVVVSGGSVGALSSVEGSVQRAIDGGGGGDLDAVQSALDCGGGESLEPGVRAEMESSFGRSMGSVRVHTDSAAATAASSIGAAAFTVGQDIYFGADRYTPDTVEGKHLLAHELTHTVQQGAADTVQAKLIQAEPAANTPPAAATTPDAAQTSWNINFENQFAGTGKPVEARKGDSSLYVREFKVAPAADAGKPPPAPKVFAGVTLGKSGSAHMGTYTHPKGKGGKASANVAYGKKPTFDFSIKTVSEVATKEEKAEKKEVDNLNKAGKAHTEVVNELAKQLDDFVDQAEAQAILQKIVNEKFEHVAVEATIKIKDSAKEAINTTDLNYSSVDADKTFNVKVTVPQVTKDKSTSYTQNENGEVTKGVENTKEKGKENETKVVSKAEQEFISSVTKEVGTAVSNLAEHVKTNLKLDESVITKEHTFAAQNATQFKLSGKIAGSAGLDLGKVPVVGEFLGDLLDAKLNVDLNPEMNNTTTLNYGYKNTDAKKKLSSEESKVRSEVAAKITTTWNEKIESKFRSSLETSTTEKTTEKEGEKKNEGEKKTEGKSSTTTTGSVTVVAGAVQPVLTEE